MFAQGVFPPFFVILELQQAATALAASFADVALYSWRAQ